MYRDMGGAIPPLTATLLELSSFHLLVPLLTVSDLAVFALFYWLARRQPGLLFVPAALYFVSAGLLMLALYAPMHSAIQLVP
jgi:type II secretory pathway component PulF